MGGSDPRPQPLVSQLPPPITSRQNPRLKQAAALRDRRERRRTGRLLVDGARESLRAVQAGVSPIEAFFVADDDSEKTREVVDRLKELGTPVYPVARGAFEKLAYGDRGDGVVLVAEAAPTPLDRLPLGADPLVVVLEGVEKPGNLGAILRTADGAGVDAVVVADAAVDLYNPNAIRASVGAVFREGVAVATAAEARAWLVGRGLRVFATKPDAPRRYTEADLAGPAAVVLGSEAAGLSDAWDGPGVEAVSLPMLGVADSLNVSAAAAAMLYEARRQRDATR